MPDDFAADGLRDPLLNGTYSTEAFIKNLRLAASISAATAATRALVEIRVALVAGEAPESILSYLDGVLSQPYVASCLAGVQDEMEQAKSGD